MWGLHPPHKKYDIRDTGTRIMLYEIKHDTLGSRKRKGGNRNE